MRGLKPAATKHKIMLQSFATRQSISSGGGFSPPCQVLFSKQDFKDRSPFASVYFAPFGTVVKGVNIVDSFYADYGDGSPGGKTGPDQGRIQMEGNAYLEKSFPKLDFIKSATILSEGKK